MRRMTSYFFQGLLFTAPIAFTIYVFYAIFHWIDEPVKVKLNQVLGNPPTQPLVPGVGFLLFVVVAVGMLMLIGFLCQNLLTSAITRIVERQFSRFPLIRLIHNSIKDLVGAFGGDKRKFDQPVLVTVVPSSDAKLVGFVTRKTMEIWGMSDQIAVFVPMSFTFGGNLLVVPKDRVKPLNVSVADAMAFVVSGGIAGDAKERAAALNKGEETASAGNASA